MGYDNVPRNCGFSWLAALRATFLKCGAIFFYFSFVGYFTTLLVPQNL
jgi:hypothetical protein